MRYQGTTNWLVSVAPYSFPTATVALLLAFTLVFAWGASGAGAMGDVFGEVWRLPLNPILARGWGLCVRAEWTSFVCGR